MVTQCDTPKVGQIFSFNIKSNLTKHVAKYGPDPASCSIQVCLRTEAPCRQNASIVAEKVAGSEPTLVVTVFLA